MAIADIVLGACCSLDLCCAVPAIVLGGIALCKLKDLEDKRKYPQMYPQQQQPGEQYPQQQQPGEQYPQQQQPGDQYPQQQQYGKPYPQQQQRTPYEEEELATADKYACIGFGLAIASPIVVAIGLILVLGGTIFIAGISMSAGSMAF